MTHAMSAGFLASAMTFLMTTAAVRADDTTAAARPHKSAHHVVHVRPKTDAPAAAAMPVLPTPAASSQPPMVGGPAERGFPKSVQVGPVTLTPGGFIAIEGR